LDNCWGFIDCTIRSICRPTKHQQIIYSGYKKVHALKYSAVKCPDGIIYHLAGAYEGRRNDNFLLRDSRLLLLCATFATDTSYLTTTCSNFVLYGDPAYSIGDFLLSPYAKSKTQSDEEFQFNIRMSAVRESMEWGFGEVLRLWNFLDHTPT
jgi:nuclease HARBI1